MHERGGPDVALDFGELLRDWPYDPREPQLRIVRGADGRDLLQVRLELGLLQLQLDGRPDGQRPRECDSWLTWFQRQRAAEEAAQPDRAPPLLDSTECQLFLREIGQYGYRARCFWQLKRFELCARDTRRNLTSLRFVQELSRHAHDRALFAPHWIPTLFLHAKAVATPLADLGQWDAALAALAAGVAGIEQRLAEQETPSADRECLELTELRALHEQVQQRSRQPRTFREARLTRLEEELAAAISAEQYEQAARLRDTIAQLRSPPASDPDQQPAG